MNREVIVVLTTNLESQEFQCHYGEERGLPPGHPRARLAYAYGAMAAARVF